MSEQFGKGKKKPKLYQPGRVYEENCKSAKGNLVIKFLGILRNSGPTVGQLWKGRAQSSKALGAGFSSLLLRVPFCLCHMQSAVCKEKVLNRYGIDIILSCLCSVLDCLNF